MENYAFKQMVECVNALSTDLLGRKNQCAMKQSNLGLKSLIEWWEHGSLGGRYREQIRSCPKGKLLKFLRYLGLAHKGLDATCQVITATLLNPQVLFNERGRGFVSFAVTEFLDLTVKMDEQLIAFSDYMPNMIGSAISSFLPTGIIKGAYLLGGEMLFDGMRMILREAILRAAVARTCASTILITEDVWDLIGTSPIDLCLLDMYHRSEYAVSLLHMLVKED